MLTICQNHNEEVIIGAKLASAHLQNADTMTVHSFLTVDSDTVELTSFNNVHI